MNKLTWHTEQRKINDLIPYEENPRQMSEKQVRDLQKSLERFDLVEIPCVDLDLKICAGHQRLKIMQLLGRGSETIDVRMPNRKLTDREFREYNLRSNKNVGSWDYDMLANIDEVVLEDIGFESDELDKIFQLDGEQDDAIPEVRETNVKRGEIFQLGRHRLMCGDAMNRGDVERLINGEKADMVFTDPPYDFNFDFLKYLIEFTQGHIFFLHNDKSHIRFANQYFKYFVEPFIILYHHLPTIIGAKRGILPCNVPIRKHVLIAHYRTLKAKIPKYHKFSSVFDIENDIIISENVIECKSHYDRSLPSPYAKKVEIIEPFILTFSKRNDIVVDVFGECGSTLIAAEKHNRICNMLEIEPQYCQVIIDRWQDYTGEKVRGI